MRNPLSRFTKPEELKPVDYRIGDYVITLPPDHLLPKYQAMHRLYDRFPLVLGQMKYDGWIVDIGANIGDTLAALASFNPKQIICIEPDAEWFEQLEDTARNVRRNGSRIVCVQSAVGPHGERADFERTSSSTAHLKQSASGERDLKSLDSIVLPIIADCELALLKCDIDGFDAIALDSGRNVITNHLPLLYVEAEIHDRLQLEAWERTIFWLKQAGYDRFVALDNFGLPLLRRADTESIIDCLRYTLNMNCSASTRTSWYFDLFATTDRRQQQFEEIMRRYESQFVGANYAAG
jgi:FkbM family methyltransferase